MPQIDELDTASALVLRQRANFVAFNTITGNYTLVAGDWGKWIKVNSGSAVVVTVPNESSVAFADGVAIPIIRYGAGTVTVTPESGVTINSDGEDTVIPSQFKTALLIKCASNTWLLQGIGAAGSSGGGLTQLSTPTLTMTFASSTAIDFSYTNVANESSYYVQIATDSGFTTGVQTATPAANDTAHQFTGLTANTLYYGRVKAVGDGVTYSDSAYGTDSETTDISIPGNVMTQTGLNSTSDPWLNTGALPGWETGDIDGNSIGTGERIFARRKFSDGIYFMLGFDSSPTPGAYTTWDTGVLIDAGGALSRITAGAFTSLSPETLSVGEFIGLLHVDATTIKIQTSNDASSWTDIYTFSGGSYAAMYPFAAVYDDTAGTSGKLYTPRQQGLS